MSYEKSSTRNLPYVYLISTQTFHILEFLSSPNNIEEKSSFIKCVCPWLKMTIDWMLWMRCASAQSCQVPGRLLIWLLRTESDLQRRKVVKHRNYALRFWR